MSLRDLGNPGGFVSALAAGLRSMLRRQLTEPGSIRGSRDATPGKGALVGDGSDLW